LNLRVTFDTNVLDLACRPERFPKDSRQPHLRKVRDALVAKRIHGFYSVAMLTIEGIMRKDRAEVFGSTGIARQSESIATAKNADLPAAIRAEVGDADIEKVEVTYVVDQPKRKPLHPEVVARVQAARALDVRVLKTAPRVGAYTIDDPNNEFYLSNGEGDALRDWIDRITSVADAIEGRGVGYAQVKALGQSLAAHDPAAAWFDALTEAKDIHQERAVERAFGEWADAEAISAHIAYGLDVFCSADVGNSNATNSVLDPINRAWLTATYGVKFISFDELLTGLP